MPSLFKASPIDSHLRTWTEDDGVDTVRLLARAYTGSSAARAFAPRGTLEEWAQYVAQIIKTPGCGRFLQPASVSVQHPADDRLRGLVLTTSLQRDTAHIVRSRPNRARHAAVGGRRRVRAVARGIPPSRPHLRHRRSLRARRHCAR